MPQPSGTGHGPVLGPAWGQLMAPGKGFPLVALGDRHMPAAVSPAVTAGFTPGPSQQRGWQARATSLALQPTLVGGWSVDQLHRCSKAAAA